MPSGIGWPHAVIALAIAGALGFGAWASMTKDAARQQAKVDLERQCIEAGGSYRTSAVLGRPRCKLPKEKRR